MDAARIVRFSTSIAAAVLSMSAVAGEIDVSAAVSLSDALKEIQTAYEKETGDRVRLNLGASSMLARQIRSGAPVDVFL
jgi:ABC-type molybdate transport system substrate-binding protein